MESSQAKEGDTFYTCLPLCHGLPITSGIMPALLLGSTVVLRERFSASRFWDDIRLHGCTVFCTTGTLLAMLCNQPPRSDDADNPARVCVGSSNLSARQHLDFEQRFNLKYVENYGLTEAGLVLLNSYQDDNPGSCGRPIPSLFDVRIFDEDDMEVPANVTGEIVVRPQTPWSIMSGYYKDAERTLETYDNLWFHTGDLAYRDEQGLFYFARRKKEAIRRRGENISCVEVESVINSHPRVLESAAVGVPSDLGEDDLMICIVLKPGEELAPDELLRFCEQRLSDFAVPRYIRFKDSLPKTASERVQRYLLSEEFPNPDIWDREKAGYGSRK
jgi:crotonobetaine/carnitine-CoA ligase